MTLGRVRLLDDSNVRGRILHARVLAVRFVLFGIDQLSAAKNFAQVATQLGKVIAQNAGTDARHAVAAAQRAVAVTLRSAKARKLSTSFQTNQSPEVSAVRAILTVKRELTVAILSQEATNSLKFNESLTM